MCQQLLKPLAVIYYFAGMQSTRFIRNMVCNRCIRAVEQVFTESGFPPAAVRMGEVDLTGTPDAPTLDRIGQRLRELGFELLDDQKQQLIARIKALLITQVQSGEIPEHFVLSEYLSRNLLKDYSQLSRLFPEVEGITIEQFFIQQRIEKVKEWMTYNELTLSEMAWKLGYSSVAHLSAQFKKVTGLSPTEFRKLGVNHRKPLDAL